MQPHASRLGVVEAALVAALILLPWLPFGQTLSFSFTGFDDQLYVSDNPHVLGGLSGDNVRWAFTTFQTANWHPLTWLSLMLDASIGGSSPAVYHATNVVLHSIATALIFLALRRGTGSLPRSAALAAFFTIHPLRAESVAWIAERKDVLSAALFALALYLYLAPGQVLRGRRRLVLVLVYALGLLAKPMLVTLPPLLLLLDFWPLRRWDPAKEGWVPPLPLWKEKWPLFLLAAGSSAITLVAQSAGGAVAGIHEASFGPGQRLANALVSVVAYVIDTFWPRNLAVLYPYPVHGLPTWQVVGGLILMVGVTAIAVRQCARRPYLVVGWLWFLLMLVPVLGIVQIGIQSRADRYTYLPSIGLLLLVVWLIADLVVTYLSPATARWAATGAVLLATGALATACAHQTAYWRDRLTLFTRLAEAVPEYPNGHLTVGLELERQGDANGALRAFENALRVAPGSADVHANLANWNLRHGSVPQALEHAAQSARLGPSYPESHLVHGRALARAGRHAEAVASFRRALELNPALTDARTGLAYSLAESGAVGEAVAAFSEALRDDPRNPALMINLGILLSRQGQYEKAVEALTAAVTLAPENAQGISNLASALWHLGREDDALARFDQALRIDSQLSSAHFGRGLVLARRGNKAAAIAEFERVLQLQPDNDLARRNLAILHGAAPAGRGSAP